jgi:hypothetical protein
MSDPSVNQTLKKIFGAINTGGNAKDSITDLDIRNLVLEFRTYQGFQYQDIRSQIEKKIRNVSGEEQTVLKNLAVVNGQPAIPSALIPGKPLELSKDQNENINLAVDREFSVLIKKLSYALENKIIDANKLLIWAIALCSDKTQEYDIMLMSLALRFGEAEPNMYLLVPEYGNTHLVVYAVLEMEKRLMKTSVAKDYISRDTIEKVLLLLGLMGSKTSSLAIYEEQLKFDSKGIPEYDSKILRIASQKNKEAYKTTVAQWLVSKQYPHFLNPCEDLERMAGLRSDPARYKIKYGLLTDDVKYAFPEGTGIIKQEVKDKYGVKRYKEAAPVQPSFFDCVKYNAVRVEKNLTLVNVVRNSESDVLRYCLDTLALELFENCLMRGFKMSYFTMNRLCILYTKRTSKDRYDRVSSEVYLRMLLYAAGTGVRIDEYQFDYIKTKDEDYKNKNTGSTAPSKQIETMYEKPLWEKACSTSEKAPLPKSLILIATSLGVLSEDGTIANPKINKKETCMALAALASEDPSKIQTDAIDRQRERIRATAYTLAEFTSGPFSVDCENNGPMNTDPLEYNDAALAYYKDDKDKLYCFPSTMFEDLTQSRKNPFANDKPLPADILNKMKTQLDVFTKLGINPNKILPAGTAAEQLQEKDVINNDHTDFSINTIVNMFKTQGVPKSTLQALNTEQFNAILSKMYMNQDYLKDLPSNYQFATFCKAMYSYIKKNETQIPAILRAILIPTAPAVAKTL